MKRLLAIAAVALLTLTGCDDWPYDSGQVRDKDYNDGTYYLKLSHVIAHGEVQGWQPVSPTVYGNCQVGEHWEENSTDGCPQGGGGGASW